MRYDTAAVLLRGNRAFKLALVKEQTLYWTSMEWK